MSVTVSVGFLGVLGGFTLTSCLLLKKIQTRRAPVEEYRTGHITRELEYQIQDDVDNHWRKYDQAQELRTKEAKGN
jgi:hypothetical protein